MPPILVPFPNPDSRNEDELEAEQFGKEQDERTENEDWGDCNSHYGRDYQRLCGLRGHALEACAAPI